MANNYTIVDATEQTTLSAEDIGSSVKVPTKAGEVDETVKEASDGLLRGLCGALDGHGCGR